MDVDPDNTIAIAALDELAKTRAALVTALGGGEDGIPPGTTTSQMVDALHQLNRFYHNGWGESHARLNQAKRTLREHGISTHTSTPVRARGPLSTASWGGIDPPAVYWVPDGDDAGVYIYSPKGPTWTRVNFDDGVAFFGDSCPPGAEQLFCWMDVRMILNEYRELRRDQGMTDISDQRHNELLDEVWALMLDASDWPVVAADMRHEREQSEDA